MLAIQPIHSLGLVQAMSPTTARRIAEKTLTRLRSFPSNGVLEFTSSPLSQLEYRTLTQDGLQVVTLTPVDAALFQSFNAAVDTLLATAAEQTKLTQEEVEARGLRPEIFSGTYVADIKPSVEALIKYAAASQQTFPWKPVLGFAGLMVAIGGGAYLLHHQTATRRPRRRRRRRAYA